MGDKNIKLLNDSLIDKIAAGEVVENPSSVVKELIENSIDADADMIDIEVKEGGKSLIKVKDSGRGMPKEDAELCIKRHSTSKIEDEADLFAIKSLGFRGEALASISAVSEFSIVTKTEDELKGTEVTVRKNNVSVNEIGAEKGTIVKVENLFYNVPARKKFLKSMSSELSSVIDIVARYALAYNNISFKLVSDGKVVINTAASKDELNSIASIYGNETAKNMIRVDFKDRLIKLNGYIGKPVIARNDKQRQSLYINGRFIKSKELAEAVKQGYYSLLFLDREPVFVLKIEVDEKKVDVNVHPRKEIVKITSAKEICESISNAITQALKQSNLVVDADLRDSAAKAQAKYAFFPDKQSTLAADSAIEAGSVYDNLKGAIVSSVIETKHIGPFKILGQVNKTYIVAENAEGLLIIDQHAAEERVNYEKLVKMMKDSAIKKQELLKPMIVETSPSEFEIVKEYMEELMKLGYSIEEYGKNNLLLRTVPFIFERQSKTMVNELIDELKMINSNKLNDEIEERIIRFSCRKSIKAGEEMSMKEIHDLIEELDKCELPFTCPHGRPTIISIGLSEMEKKFKRRG